MEPPDGCPAEVYDIMRQVNFNDSLIFATLYTLHYIFIISKTHYFFNRHGIYSQKKDRVFTI